jgi:hypothetical protein
MGKLLSTIFAILVTYWVVAPAQVAAHFDTPQIRTARAQLAADRPGEKLWNDTKAWLAAR